MTDLSHDSLDDGFHEIQLSGKQLVFLFMATTVVSVVIFLCGVLVGRGVRAESLNAADRTTPVSTGGPGATTPDTLTPPPPVVDPSAEPPTSTLKQRLEADKAVPEIVKPQRSPDPAPSSGATAAPDSTPATPERSAPKTEPAAALPAEAPPATSPGQRPQPGVWAVQVVALTDRGAAAAVVQRLTAKGYPAFLVPPASGAPVQNYKVQVGRFEARSEAEVIAGRLKKEEQFQPWILR